MLPGMTSESTRINGYGASVEFDGATLRIIARKVQEKIWHTGSVSIPVQDITDIEYRAASALVNGVLRLTTARPANDYAAAPSEGAQFTTVPSNGLVVHWRRKDHAAFASLYEALTTTKAPPPGS